MNSFFQIYLQSTNTTWIFTIIWNGNCLTSVVLVMNNLKLELLKFMNIQFYEEMSISSTKVQKFWKFEFQKWWFLVILMIRICVDPHTQNLLLFYDTSMECYYQNVM